MLLPCIGIWHTPPNTVGAATPAMSSTVGVMSITSTNCRRSPGFFTPAGQENTNGVCTPPAYGHSLYIWNGVFDTAAQGRGYSGCVVGVPISSRRSYISWTVVRSP